MTHRHDVVIVGAGPYGLAAAAHLRAKGFDAAVFGQPFDFWRTQTPVGMWLRSPIVASAISDPQGALTLPRYAAGIGHRLVGPTPAELFCDYGLWFAQQAVPDLDQRNVKQVDRVSRGFHLMLDDGESCAADRVVVAAGVGKFGWRPPQFADLDASVASHTLDHRDLGRFAGQRVSVVGGGQSALESAALLHEAGSDIDILIRAPEVRWLGQRSWLHKWPLGPMLYAPPDVGPAGVSQLVARPALFRRLPRRTQLRLGPRSIRPAGSGWLRPRLASVPIRTGVNVRRATRVGRQVRLELENGSQQTVDHVLLGTGYRVDLAKYSFLSSDLVASIATARGYPLLSKGFETSVPGLHILGAPAAWSFGPLMRFVAGSDFAARGLAGSLGS